jgi:adenosylcobinamide-GDP ribazoletransferase
MLVVRAFRAALGLLTRLPVGRGPLGPDDVARGAPLFPVVGAGIGAAAGGLAILVHPQLPALVAAVLAVALELALTGALHLDGLADTFDALGAFTRERALEIMSDSRLGTFGTAALTGDLLLRTALIAALLERGGVVVSLVAAGALSRAAMLPLATALRYLRPEPGVSELIGPWPAAVGVAVGVAIAVGFNGVDGLWTTAAAAVTAAALGLGFRRRFGGITGDMLGATAELTGIAALLVAVWLR